MNPYSVSTGNMFREYRPMSFTKNLAEGTQILRERYDTNLENHSLLDRAIGSIRTLSDADAAKVNAAKYDIENNIIGGRVDYENMGKVIRDASTRLIADHGIQDAVRSYENYQQELEENAKLTAQGHKVLDFNMVPVKGPDGKIMFNPDGSPMMEHRTKQWDSSTMGVYQRGSEMKTDWDAQAQQLIQGIQTDTLSPEIRNAMIAADVDPRQLSMWLRSDEGLTERKIREIAKALTSVFKFTTEGAQMDRFLQQLSINPETKDLYTPEQAEKEIEKFLFDIALKQKGIKSRIFQSAAVESGELPPLQSPLTIISPREDLEKTEKFSDMGDLFDKDGNFKDKKSLAESPIYVQESSTAAGLRGSKVPQMTRMGTRPPIAEKIENAVAKGEEGSLNWRDISKNQVAAWILTSDFVAEHFDKAGKTDRQIVEEVTDALRPRMGDKNIVPVSSEGASNLARLALANNQIFQPNGNAWKDLTAWADEGTRMAWEKESSLINALHISLELAAKPDAKLSKENDVYNSSTVLRATGRHAGKLVHSFTWNGKPREILLGPADGTSEAFALNQAIARVRSSINPGKEEKITSLAVDENGNQREVTGKIKNKIVKVDGKPVLKTVIVYGEGASQQEIDASEFEDFQARVILNSWAGQGNLLKQTFNIHKDTRERPYTR